MRRRRRCALDLIEGDRGRERRQVVRAHLCRRLEARGELNQGRLAERRPEEADAKRRAEHDAGGHLLFFSLFSQ